MSFKKLSTGLLLLTVAMCGCGGSSDTPKLGKVSGKLQVDGKPAAKVNVFFSPSGGGRSSSGVTDADGNYTLTFNTSNMGAIVGEHKVSIAPEAPDPDKPSEPGKPLTDNGGIPEKYLSEKKTVEVKAGDNKIDISFP